MESKRTGTITNYYVKGDILSSTIKEARIGTTIWLDTQCWSCVPITIPIAMQKGWKIKVPNLFANHKIDTVIRALTNVRL